MTPAEFQACVPLAEQLSSDRVAAARSVLVDGEGLTEVAARYDWSRQAVGNTVKRLWEVWERYKAAKQYEAEMAEAALPPGWRVVTVAVPNHLLVKLRAEVGEAAAAAGIPADNVSF